MKFLIMPDSFKGTLSSREVAETIKNCIVTESPEAEALAIPVSDGGEGLVDCVLQAAQGASDTLAASGMQGESGMQAASGAQGASGIEAKRVSVDVTGPNGHPIDGFYGKLADRTAVVEMAAAAGLSLAAPESSPIDTTTYGVGELIHHAIKSGCRKIIIGLGGSATNDAGAGMAAALGTRFYDKAGNEFVPVGGTLLNVSRIDMTQTKKLLEGVTVEAMCDIGNPMYGPEGAAFVFAPQKGADEVQVRFLDENLRAFDEVIQRELGISVSEVPGAGAAGAMGAGVVAFLEGRLVRGIDAMLDLVSFDKLAQGCDWVVTGEGKLDRTSLSGKVPIGITRRAKALGKLVIAIVGKNELSPDEARREGIDWVFETSGTGAKHGLAADDYLGALQLTAKAMLRTI